MTQQPDSFASSTGQAFSEADWLDAHFVLARTEYEAQLRAVGIQSGWHVLDAACGTGSYLPWMAELVGPQGHLSALDLAPENLEQVNGRIAKWELACPVLTEVGTVLELPYPDDEFDAVWFANTSQYLTDDELATTLAEFRRVVRPGGLVALKESDGTLYRIHPGPPGLALHFFQGSAVAGDIQMAAGLRSPALPGWLRRSGLVDVWQRSTLIECAAPLEVAAYTFWNGALAYWAELAADLDLPAADCEFWKQLRRPGALERFLADPNCCLIEGNILTVGRVPENPEGS